MLLSAECHAPSLIKDLMEEMSQRVDDAWSEEDMCSDEEIDEQGQADLLHDFIAWMDIYAVNAYLSQKRRDRTLTRSNAGAWATADDLKCFEVFEEKSPKKHMKKRKG